MRAVDFLGTGCAGLLWSGARLIGQQSNYGFLDFTGGVKPHLLSTIDNSMGLETTIAMQPSTAYLAAELREGRRWTGHLPFPVQVVARVTSHDCVADTRLVTRYSYAHGVFDGRRRQFAGFARVETIDDEGVAGDSSRRFDARAAGPDARRWFHVGISDDENFSIAAALEGRYQGDALAVTPASRVDVADSAADAIAAMRGAQLRIRALRARRDRRGGASAEHRGDWLPGPEHSIEGTAPAASSTAPPWSRLPTLTSEARRIAGGATDYRLDRRGTAAPLRR